jgi:hypothetical protein
MQESKSAYEELMTKINELALRYNYMVTGKLRTVSVLKLLTSNVCEERIRHNLEAKEVDSDEVFDSIYAERSSFATNVIIDVLKSALIREGFKVGIVTEQKSAVGRYDIVIEAGNPCVVYSNGPAKRIRIEVKASFGLPFEQIQRYLFDPSPLILARVLPGQVIKLDPLTLQSFIDFSARTLIEKSERILNNKGYLVRGPHCSQCGNDACPFLPKREDRRRLVTMSEEELAWEMQLFLNNLPHVATKVAELVLEELKEGKENDAV